MNMQEWYRFFPSRILFSQWVSSKLDTPPCAWWFVHTGEEEKGTPIRHQFQAKAISRTLETLCCIVRASIALLLAKKRIWDLSFSHHFHDMTWHDMTPKKKIFESNKALHGIYVIGSLLHLQISWMERGIFKAASYIITKYMGCKLKITYSIAIQVVLLDQEGFGYKQNGPSLNKQLHSV